MEVELEEELLGRVSSAPGGAAGVPGPFQPVALVLSTLLCAEAARPPRLTSQAWCPLGGDELWLGISCVFHILPLSEICDQYIKITKTDYKINFQQMCALF